MAPKQKQASESYARPEHNKHSSILSRISDSINRNIRDQIIFTLLLETGCTAKELAEIRTKDIGFTTNSITLGTGRRRREVLISARLGSQLKHFSDSGREHLFETRQSRRISGRRVMQLTRRYAEAFIGRDLNTQEIRALSIRESSLTEPAERVKEKTGLKSIRTKTRLSPEQIRRIRAGIEEEQHRLIFDVLCETGCRTNELIGIRPRDLDLEKGTIRFSGRTSQISQHLSLQIKAFATDQMRQPSASSRFLFSTRQSVRMSAKRVFQVIRDYAMKAGLEGVGPQILRNTWIARAIEDGKSAKEIEKQTGVKHVDLHHYGLSQKKEEDKGTR